MIAEQYFLAWISGNVYLAHAFFSFYNAVRERFNCDLKPNSERTTKFYHISIRFADLE